MTEGQRYDTSPLGEGHNWVNKVGGLPDFARAIAHALIRDGHSESEAVQLAIGVLKNWASGKGKVHPSTRARAAAAVARWESMKAASGKRAMGPVTEGSSAGDLIPRGPSSKQAKTVVDTLEDSDVPHAFRGSDVQHCTVCGLSATAKVHTLFTGERTAPTEGVRHRGPVGHDHVTSGHAKGDPARMTRAAKTDHLVDSGVLEPQFHAAMVKLFRQQFSKTRRNLLGPNGRSMLRSIPPQGPDDESGAEQPEQPGVSIDPTAIFDPGYWATQTAAAATPIYDNVADLNTARLRKQLERGNPGVTSNLNDSSSLAATRQILADRANQMASDVTTTTFNAIKDQLDQGYQNGESVPQLATRIRKVFDQASTSRAQTIARTETIGAMNQAANTYASNLPPSVVGRHRWLAHHDDRTRPHHRAADGQEAPMGQPYHVGGSLMRFPHDPAAPPDETINCRCTEMFLPATAAMEGLAA